MRKGGQTRRRSRRSSRRLTKSQRGGLQPIVYYTCFFGPERGIGDRIPKRPSSTAPCFFFSNNDKTLEAAKAEGWSIVKSPVSIKSTNRDNSVDAKELKACPHHFPELRGFEMTCYLDSKLNVSEKDILEFAKDLKGDVVMLVNKHPHDRNGVWREYNAAMYQPRYEQNAQRYKNYIAKREKEGLPLKSDIFYETSCILRKSSPIAEAIGEEWLRDIQETGAECQISFFFINEKYKKHIRPLARYYGRD